MKWDTHGSLHPMPRYCHDIYVFFAVGTFRFTAMDWVMGVCYESWLLYLSLEHH